MAEPDQQEIGPDKSLLLVDDDEPFLRRLAKAMGFDDQFRRLWEFYFCYCEGGFAEAILGSVQLVWAKPLAPAFLTKQTPPATSPANLAVGAEARPTQDALATVA